MACLPPPFAQAVLAEATRIAPGRRSSSDGICADAAHYRTGGDHVPDSRGIPHAVDISQSKPGAPFWESRFAEFDAHALGDRIAERIKAGTERRVKYLVSHNYQSGAAKVWSLERPYWHDQPGDDHASHLHVSFTVGAEQSVAPFFQTVSQEDDDMPLNAADIEAIRQIVKQTVEAAIGGASLDPPDPHATVAEVVKRYVK